MVSPVGASDFNQEKSMLSIYFSSSLNYRMYGVDQDSTCHLVQASLAASRHAGQSHCCAMPLRFGGIIFSSQCNISDGSWIIDGPRSPQLISSSSYPCNPIRGTRKNINSSSHDRRTQMCCSLLGSKNLHLSQGSW